MKPTGFTLIELLIVVAIIAILAAIAVPNFLEAQTRSNVSRVKADIRTIKVGIESYVVDTNKYPDPATYKRNGADSMTRLEELTSPVAYLTSIPRDPFNLHGIPSVIGPEELVYYTDQAFNSRALFDQVLGGFGDGSPSARRYFVFSIGPDQKCDYVLGPYTPRGSIQYDPTNGTLSKGDLAEYGP